MRNIGIDFGTCNLKANERRKNGDINYVKLGKTIDKEIVPNVILYESKENDIITYIGDIVLKKMHRNKTKLKI